MAGKIRPVLIDEVSNGYIVRVGCQTLVFQNRAVLILELSEYLDDPEGAEKAFLTEHPWEPLNIPIAAQDNSVGTVGQEYTNRPVLYPQPR